MTEKLSVSKQLENLLVDCGIHDHPILGKVEVLEAQVAELQDGLNIVINDNEEWQKNAQSNYNLKMRAEAENQSLKEQNEKLFRKFKRIPATIADAYNTNIELKSRLSEASKVIQEYCNVCEEGADKTGRPPCKDIECWFYDVKKALGVIAPSCTNTAEEKVEK